ncbi:MAG: amidophosphoribosyltransferase [Deltaproteobacteria bacterium]|nr:amidophosphoribosyltransferase [Deltaproteobacteria bacterium]
MEGFRDEGGLFGIAGHRLAAHLTYIGLHALQHRGQDGAGIVVSDGDLLRGIHGSGLVQEAFAGTLLQGLRGQSAIGQVVRSGRDTQHAAMAAQRLPLLVRYRGGQLAVAMTGRFTNGSLLRQRLKDDGALFTTLADAEILLHLLATSRQKTLVNRLVDALWQVEGAFSIVLLSEDRMIAVRDPNGFRPLLRGRHEGATVVATEDGPIRFLGGEIRSEIEPGQMVIVDEHGESAVRPFPSRPRSACIQEYVEIAPADAHVFGQATYSLRVALGERLARERPSAGAEVVVSLPGAATPIGVGYARVAGLPAKEGLVRTPYTRRNYVEPPQELRDFGSRLRWTPVPVVVDQQVVVLVVASITTGEMVRKAVRLLRGAGAREVHLRVASPPVTGTCHYGVSSPTADELATSRHGGPVELSGWLGTESVGFLSVESLHAILGCRTDGTPQWCDGCFSGDYPVVPAEELEKDQLPLFEDGEEDPSPTTD